MRMIPARRRSDRRLPGSPPISEAPSITEVAEANILASIRRRLLRGSGWVILARAIGMPPWSSHQRAARPHAHEDGVRRLPDVVHARFHRKLDRATRPRQSGGSTRLPITRGRGRRTGPRDDPSHDEDRGHSRIRRGCRARRTRPVPGKKRPAIRISSPRVSLSRRDGWLRTPSNPWSWKPSEVSRTSSVRPCTTLSWSTSQWPRPSVRFGCSGRGRSDFSLSWRSPEGSRRS